MCVLFTFVTSEQMLLGGCGRGVLMTSVQARRHLLQLAFVHGGVVSDVDDSDESATTGYVDSVCVCVCMLVLVCVK
jgi:hypothetical protein